MQKQAETEAGAVPLPMMFGNSEVFSLPPVSEESFSRVAPVGSFLQEAEEAGPSDSSSSSQQQVPQDNDGSSTPQEEQSSVLVSGGSSSALSGFRFPSMIVSEALEARSIMIEKPNFTKFV
jgi:hypothetical protein